MVVRFMGSCPLLSIRLCLSAEMTEEAKYKDDSKRLIMKDRRMKSFSPGVTSVRSIQMYGSVREGNMSILIVRLPTARSPGKRAALL